MIEEGTKVSDFFPANLNCPPGPELGSGGPQILPDVAKLYLKGPKNRDFSPRSDVRIFGRVMSSYSMQVLCAMVDLWYQMSCRGKA